VKIVLLHLKSTSLDLQLSDVSLGPHYVKQLIFYQDDKFLWLPQSPDTLGAITITNRRIIEPGHIIKYIFLNDGSPAIMTYSQFYHCIEGGERSSTVST
jgi:hypothetical protein